MHVSKCVCQFLSLVFGPSVWLSICAYSVHEINFNISFAISVFILSLSYLCSHISSCLRFIQGCPSATNVLQSLLCMIVNFEWKMTGFSWKYEEIPVFVLAYRDQGCCCASAARDNVNIINELVYEKTSFVAVCTGCTWCLTSLQY